jgi:hypothetical protein
LSNMKSCNCDPTFRRVQIRNGNYSDFESPKGQFHYSDYSLIRCLACGWCWRTNAKWVKNTADITEEELNERLKHLGSPNLNLFKRALRGTGLR